MANLQVRTYPPLPSHPSMKERADGAYQKMCPGGFTETRQLLVFKVVTVICRLVLVVFGIALPLVATILLITNKLLRTPPWFLILLISVEFVRQVMDGLFTFCHYMIAPDGRNRLIAW